MSDSIVLTGVVATAPRSITTPEGLAITSFRLASAQRRFDRSSGSWVDAETNWYSVAAFRRLAENAAQSLAKGDRVLVSGRVKVREWESAGRTGTTVEVEADGIGHDLSWGCSRFVKRGAAARVPDDATVAVPAASGEPSPADDAPGGAEASPVSGQAGAGSWAAPLGAVPF